MNNHLAIITVIIVSISLKTDTQNTLKGQFFLNPAACTSTYRKILERIAAGRSFNSAYKNERFNYFPFCFVPVLNVH